MWRLGGYSLPSSSVCSSYILLLFCVSAISSSSSSPVARRPPFDFRFVSTTRVDLTRECVKGCFGVPPDHDVPVGDGGEDTTRCRMAAAHRWLSPMCVLCSISSLLLLITLALVPLHSTRMRPQSVVAALQQVGQI